MTTYFDIYRTRIPIDSIKDFRIIEVEFIFRPVFQEVQRGSSAAFLGFNIFAPTSSTDNCKFEFVSMQPYAAIIGQQGHKSALGEYKAKDFKEALGKDLSGAVIYTIADKFKLKAFKHQKYQCLNLAGRAFTTYLDDIPVKLTWNNGKIAEIFKEDPLYTTLAESTTPGIQYVPALVIKANETFCFYGSGIQIEDVDFEYNRLKEEIDAFRSNKQNRSLFGAKEKLTLPQVPKLRLPTKSESSKESASANELTELENSN